MYHFNRQHFRVGDYLTKSAPPNNVLQFNGPGSRTNLKAALALAKRGFFIIPVSKQGVALVDPRAASRKSVRVNRWWRHWPNADIGVHLGKSELLMVEGSGAALAALALPPTLAASGGDVTRLFYRCGQGVWESLTSLDNGVRVYAGNSVVVVPSSPAVEDET